MKHIRLIGFWLFLFVLSSCSHVTIDSYLSKWNDIEVVQVRDGRFYKGDNPYYFIGANYWYGPLLGSAALGNRERLLEELDLMKENGIDNLRILIGAEGDGGDSKVHPALQPEQGVYNEDLLDGLDYLLMQMRKRDMYAILYMNNNWIWSGGMSTYLTWNGYGEVPNPFLEKYSWPEYMRYTEQFVSCEPCKQAYYDHVKFMMGRKNVYTDINYTDDHTIMSWQVANEPRIMSEDHAQPFAEWLSASVELIKSIDPVHLISTGAEGKASYLDSLKLFTKLHDNANIDYLTMHMWPKNWGWYSPDNEEATLDSSIVKGRKYMEEHIEVARKLGKPIVMSEFGFPREKESLSPLASVAKRDVFYQSIIDQILASQEKGSVLAGLNFWGFGGFAQTRPEDGKWRQGDDFCGDPPQEPQGLNTVFASDSTTLTLIRMANEKILENTQ